MALKLRIMSQRLLRWQRRHLRTFDRDAKLDHNSLKDDKYSTARSEFEDSFHWSETENVEERFLKKRQIS
mgnify:CR=1 FL=1|jgi:t-SNARE complex subunit (syntaxin)